MEDFPKQENPERSNSHWEDRAPAGVPRWLVILCVVLFAGAVFAGGYAFEQNAAMTQLKQQNLAMNSTAAQMRSQIDSLGERVAQLTAAQSSATLAETSANGARGTAKTVAQRSASARPAAQDRRFKQMQGQLAEQQKELKQTQDDLAAARSDLEGKLGSTRDELNGSIAKTHDELVSLAKRGERLFYEFDLNKSKSFQHEGPIQVSLRKADAKHQSYNLMMLVDDHQLSKKNVDLYEPIWLHQGDMPQPIQVVVNQINKDHIHGYVSAPKYRESELAQSAALQQPAAGAVSGQSSSPTSTSPSNTPSTSPSTSATTPQGQ
jgi:hypothetical protein